MATLALCSIAACSDDPTSTDGASLFEGTLNGAQVTAEPSAVLLDLANAPDTLFLTGARLDLSISVKVPYTGPGVYALPASALGVRLLVGGDGITGAYALAPSQSATLRVSSYDPLTQQLAASLEFDVTHANGEGRFGPVASFRSGRIVAPLQIQRR